MDGDKFRIEGKFKLQKIDPDDAGKIKSEEEAGKLLAKNIEKMADLQDKMYAQDRWALLLVFQAMDAAGKDGTIKNVMSGLNPQGCQVYSFKQPSSEELDHDYLWRCMKCLPERGRIGIFNRSYYEEVLVVKVHDFVKSAKIPEEFKTGGIWEARYRQIRDFERYLYENGTRVVKFFLHISKKEQKQRFLARIEEPGKRWKFSASDLKERAFWGQYQEAYEEAIEETSTKQAPWYVIPADKKWFARLAVSEVIVETLKGMNLEYPKVSKEQEKALEECRKQLLGEKD
jgi:PPK2 family polyphosphate:nucleotide phosphotransferase